MELNSFTLSWAGDSTESGQLWDQDSASSFLRKLASDPLDMLTLRSLLCAKSDHPLQTSHLNDGAVIETMATHLIAGRLQLSPPVKIAISPVIEEENREIFMVATQEKTESVKTDSWIEIEMVDEKDNPVYGTKFSITAPNGTVTRGKLDQYGRGYVRKIPAGNCIISFTDLDEDAWELA